MILVFDSIAMIIAVYGIFVLAGHAEAANDLPDVAADAVTDVSVDVRFARVVTSTARISTSESTRRFQLTELQLR
jgi:hypothetical protein